MVTVTVTVTVAPGRSQSVAVPPQVQVQVTDSVNEHAARTRRTPAPGGPLAPGLTGRPQAATATVPVAPGPQPESRE